MDEISKALEDKKDFSESSLPETIERLTENLERIENRLESIEQKMDSANDWANTISDEICQAEANRKRGVDRKVEYETEMEILKIAERALKKE